MQPTAATTKFVGMCEGLKGHIYNCTDPSRMADLYTKTTQAIGIYLGSTCKAEMDICSAMENMKKPTFKLPPDPPADTSKGMKLKFNEQIKEIAKQEGVLDENIVWLFSEVIGQCTNRLHE